MKKTKIGLVSLGCSKNLIDSEAVLAMFPLDRFALTNSSEEADVLLLNTCGFIASAKEEAIANILDLVKYKAPLVVFGCFVERNLEELKSALPEVKLWIPLRDYPRMHKIFAEVLGLEGLLPFNPMRRVISTSSSSLAYLRISEGCDHFCNFCAIPYIRGRYRSRRMDEILLEARNLKEKGIKELDVIGQDTAIYGTDFKDGTSLVTLLKELDKLGFWGIRLFYLYPEEITSSLIDFIAESKSILPYFDIPIQSASDHVLRLMNRHNNVHDMYLLFDEIRRKIPHATLRTTMISGFPGETSEDQKKTLKFIENIAFDHLGVFRYSREEGTPSYEFPHQVRESTKKRRRDEIMERQRLISKERLSSYVGKTMKALVHAKINSSLYSLLSAWNAPDDLDGKLLLHSDKALSVGDEIKVRIKKSFVYDLEAELLEIL